MKWIKPSERKPEEEGDYICRLNENRGVKQVRKIEWYEGKSYKEFWENDVEEWLDEDDDSEVEAQIKLKTEYKEMYINATKEIERLKNRMEAAENLIRIVDVPKNQSGREDNYQYEAFKERYDIWQSLKSETSGELFKRIINE